MALTTGTTRNIGLINVALGLWLLVSAFLWSHTESQFHNAWIVGALTTVVAAGATRAFAARWANTALGLWLFLSVWLLPTLAAATWWNHLLVGAAIFAVSLAPGYVRRGAPGGRRI